MSVKADSLDNAERDLELVNRDPRNAKKVAADIRAMKTGTPTAEDELQALRLRIATALTVTPRDSTPHCGDCYRRGWKAALLALQEQHTQT